MPKDANKGFVVSLVDGPAFVVVDAVSGAVKKLRASVLTAAFAPASHVGAGGAAHALATPSAHGFMSAADKATVATIQSGTWSPTISGAVNGTVTLEGTGYWQRVGDHYDLHALFLTTATVVGVVQWNLTKPAGFPAGGGWSQTVGDVVCGDSDGQSRVTRSETILTAQYAARGTATQRAWVWMKVWVGA